MVENHIIWFVRQMKKAWQRRGGKVIVIPKSQIKQFPSFLRKEVEKREYMGPCNKVGLLSSRKSAFEIGFSEGWGLAITTEEGYKWAKYHHNKRKRGDKCD